MNIFFKLQKYRTYFIKYVLAGFFCALINWTVFYLLDSRLQLYYLLSGFFAFILSTTANYFLSKIIFISKRKSKAVEYILVLAASAIALSIDLGVMYILVEFFNLPRMFSKILGTGSAFFFNYTSRQFFIFSPEKKFEEPV
jgi:putative flippase GtrA